MEKTRIVFMGTPVFGREILTALVEAGYDVVAAVCQPDKTVGRKQILTPCEVKEYALSKGIKVIQPVKIRNEYQEVLDENPDLIVTCAYGQIIPEILLNAPKHGCINVHASLLPALRGGAPIQHSIIDGYDKTGITIMEMSKAMDAGNIISQIECEIKEDDTYGSLHDRLIPLGQKLLLDTLPSVIDHSYQSIPQDPEKVTFGMNITREEEHLDLSRGYRGVYNQIRGLIPAPCCYGIVDDKKLKIWSVSTSDITCEKPDGYLYYEGKQLALVAEGRVLLIDELQTEGKNKMSARDYRKGAGRNIEGKILV
ncbi:MAG: methionyl-tRNA formyltransferase [Erysipelotrichaceae bacterium]|nr:methionyl-tRNA formyltransferase [Erysipelotrichaceae bacterium]